MSAITSGTYGLEPVFGSSILQKLGGLFAFRLVPPVSKQARVVDGGRVRVREADDVRELARSVEKHSPGFAADLYAAALRHEGYDD
jgi:hypothetical protein